MASETVALLEAGTSETTIEIKIKTMDSQTYTMQVDKQMPVPAFKDQVASVTGVVTEQQRLICRGKLMTDDQLLSAYHVEDGHTLHLVVREPTVPSSEGLPVASGLDHPSISNRGRLFQVAPDMLVETFRIPLEGERSLSDMISTVLGSFGISDSGSTGVITDQGGDRHEEAPIPEQAGVSFGSVQTPVIPEAVTILATYLNCLIEEFLNSGNDRESIDWASWIPFIELESNFFPQLGATFPTPGSLAHILRLTRRMLELTEECLLELATGLENQESLTDPISRLNAQSAVVRTGALIQNLGSYFLELGRTVMTVRLGQSPTEAAVVAGPPIFISPFGPNPLMVQQPRFSLFQRVFPPGPANSTTHQTEPAEPATGISDTSPNNGAGERGLPFRTMMNAVPDLNGSQQESSSIELLYRLLRRYRSYRQMTAGEPMQQNVGDSAGNGNAGEVMSERLLEHLRALFSQGVFEVESISSEGTETDETLPSDTDTEELEPMVTEEGLFLSRLIAQLMPFISLDSGEGDIPQQRDNATSSTPVEETEAGTSQRGDDNNSSHSSSKRQMMQ